jgi:glucosamine--fructose-6-phosphate aminotransferase (isomerizing)
MPTPAWPSTGVTRWWCSTGAGRGGEAIAAGVEAIAAAVEVGGAQVVRFAERDLGEPLSIFALTAVVQCIALDLAEARGTNPDGFRYNEDPGRERAFESIGF